MDKRKPLKLKSSRKLVSRALLYLIMVLTFIAIFVPFLWLVISSISTRSELLSVPPNWIPHNPTFKNYYDIITGGARSSEVARMFKYTLYNSFVISSTVTIISLVVGTLAAYSFARLNFFLRNQALLVIIGTRMIPAVSIIIPLYVVVLKMGLLDTKIVLILLYLSFTLPFVIWIMTSFFKSIPTDLEDAARIDGCSRLEALWRIIIPISGPGLVSTSIVAFLLAWDEFFFALIFTSTYNAKTVPVAIAEFTGRHAIDYSAMATGGVLAAIPPILLALFFQKYIVRGLTAGAVKG